MSAHPLLPAPCPGLTTSPALLQSECARQNPTSMHAYDRLMVTTSQALPVCMTVQSGLQLSMQQGCFSSCDNDQKVLIGPAL